MTAHRAAIPSPLLRVRDDLRRIPADNPRHACDALLIVANALTEAAIHAERAGHRGAADGYADIRAECRRLARSAEQLAHVFAPPPEAP